MTITVFSVLMLQSGCTFDSGEATPTAPVEEPINPLPEQSPTSTLTPTVEAIGTPTASPTAPPTSVAVVIVTSTETPPPPPTEIIPPTETPGPWEYVIQSGDTLLTIIQRDPFNYFTADVIDAIVQLNDNIPNADSLPAPGSTILIPRPTIAPTDIGFDATAEVLATQGIEMRDNVLLPNWAIVGNYEIETGDTIVGIITRFNMTLEQFSQLNRSVNFTGCNFDLPSGGDNCNPFIREGQAVNVMLPTPTLTLTPTPSGQEPPTLTPTYGAPMVVSPVNGSITSGAVTLQWVSTGVLKRDEVYLVQVNDLTAGQVWSGVTRETRLRLPDSLIPFDGIAHDIEWTITIGNRQASGEVMPLNSGVSVSRFQWQSG